MFEREVFKYLSAWKTDKQKKLLVIPLSRAITRKSNGMKKIKFILFVIFVSLTAEKDGLNRKNSRRTADGPIEIHSTRQKETSLRHDELCGYPPRQLLLCG